MGAEYCMIIFCTAVLFPFGLLRERNPERPVRDLRSVHPYRLVALTVPDSATSAWAGGRGLSAEEPYKGYLVRQWTKKPTHNRRGTLDEEIPQRRRDENGSTPALLFQPGPDHEA